MDLRVGEIMEYDGVRLLKLQRLGQGNLGVIDSYVSLSPSATRGHQLVCGRIYTDEGLEQNMASLELEILTLVKQRSFHLNIENPVPQVLGKLATPHGGVILLMEHLQAVSMHSIIQERVMTSDEVFYVARQLFKAVQNLHSTGYLHLDVNPKNVLLGFESPEQKRDYTLHLIEAALETADADLRAGRMELQALQVKLFRQNAVAKVPENLTVTNLALKLGDLKLACPKDGATLLATGSRCYLSPEALLRGAIGEKSDVYAACLTLYEAACGSPLLMCVGTTDEECDASLLAQMVHVVNELKGSFVRRCDEKGKFCFPDGRLRKADPPPGTALGLHKQLKLVLETLAGWEKEDVTALHGILNREPVTSF